MERQKCENCNHDICPYCKLGCHNFKCEWFTQPISVCYEEMNKNIFNHAVPSQLEKVTANWNKQAQLYGAEEVPNAIPPQDGLQTGVIETTGDAVRIVKQMQKHIKDANKDTQPTGEWVSRVEEIVIWFANNVDRDSTLRSELRKKLTDLVLSSHEKAIKENEVGQGLTRSEYVRLKALHQDEVSDALKKQIEELIVKTSGMARVVGEGTYCVTCKQHVASGDCSCTGYNQAIGDVLEVLKDNNK